MILTTDSRIIGIDSNNKQVRLCRFEVDDISDLPAPDVWASDGVIICMGSTAHVIGDNSEQMLDSSGQWVQQVAGTSSYTRAEIDTLLLDKVDTSTYATDKAALDAELDVLSPAVIKAVDEGAKNFVQLGFTSTSGSSSVPATTNNNDGTITVNGSRVGNATILVQDLITAQTSVVNTRYTLPAGNYVIAPTGNVNIGLQVYKHDGTNQVGLGNARLEALSFTYSDTDKVQYPYICIRLYCEGNATINNFTFMPMVCTAADWAVSQKFVPYCPTLYELYQMVIALQ